MVWHEWLPLPARSRSHLTQMLKSLHNWKVLLSLAANDPYHDTMSSAYRTVARSKSHFKCIKLIFCVHSINYSLESFKMTLHKISPPWHYVLILCTTVRFQFKARTGSRSILQSVHCGGLAVLHTALFYL